MVTERLITSSVEVGDERASVRCDRCVGGPYLPRFLHQSDNAAVAGRATRSGFGHRLDVRQCLAAREFSGRTDLGFCDSETVTDNRVAGWMFKRHEDRSRVSFQA